MVMNLALSFHIGRSCFAITSNIKFFMEASAVDTGMMLDDDKQAQKRNYKWKR